MSEWKADERLRKAQYGLDDSRDKLDFAIELAEEEGATPEAIKAMSDALGKLDEVMDDLYYAQGHLRKAPPAGK